MFAMFLALLLCALPAAAAPGFKTAPKVSPNPNTSAPLAAIVRFVAGEAVSTAIDVSGGGRKWRASFGAERDPAQGLPVLGLRPGVRYQLRVSIRNAAGATAAAPAPLAFTAPALPAEPDFPPVAPRVSEAGQVEPGITILSVRRQGGAGGGAGGAGRRPGAAPAESEFATGYGLLLGLDAAGEVVWYYRTNKRISDFKRLRNGNLVYLTADNRAVEIDALGNVRGEWYAKGRPEGSSEALPVDTLTFHHAVEEASNGNLIVLGSEIRQIENYYTSETDPAAPRARQKVKGDEIVEFRRDGEVVWRWRALDHLDPFRLGYLTFNQYWVVRGFPDTRDWSHGNGLYYDAESGAVLLSLRQQSAILKLARPSGKIEWILGEPGGWPAKLRPLLLQPEGAIRWFWHQHGPSLTPHGSVLVFDNNINQARPFEPPAPPAKSFTRAVEYRIDPARKTVREVWASEEPGPDSVYTFAMGDVDWLPRTGNILVCYGASVRREDVVKGARRARPWPVVREFTHTSPPRLLYEVVLAREEEEAPGVQWVIFGGERLSGFLPGVPD